jgi:branched-chain amino acid transport system ATP-binding protein
MLDVKGLKVNYGKFQALHGIDFHVKENRIVSLIGANGAGKTSTLMAISGMIEKEAGAVSFCGEDITSTKAHKISRMGIAHVPEGRRVFPILSVENNLITGTIADEKITKIQQKERLDEMYDFFPRLYERKKQNAGTLSGGEQQMLAIARGMMSNPKLVMLDDPSLGLAPILVEEIFGLILRIRDLGKSVLLIEQNSVVSLQISDYAYVLELGQITLEGTGKELLVNEDVKRAYLGI